MKGPKNQVKVLLRRCAALLALIFAIAPTIEWGQSNAPASSPPPLPEAALALPFMSASCRT